MELKFVTSFHNTNTTDFLLIVPYGIEIAVYTPNQAPQKNF